MKLKYKLKNLFCYRNSYKYHPEAFVLIHYKENKNDPDSLSNFLKFYETVKHLNHIVVECIEQYGDVKLGNDNPNVILSYHKNDIGVYSVYNDIVSLLDEKYKYVFWIDENIKFKNLNWVLDSVDELQPLKSRMIQLFESFVSVDGCKKDSFGYNFKNNIDYGHTGFAWGVRRSIFKGCGLYEKPTPFTPNFIMAFSGSGRYEEIKNNEYLELEDKVWVEKFKRVVGKKVGYIKGIIEKI